MRSNMSHRPPKASEVYQYEGESDSEIHIVNRDIFFTGDVTPDNCSELVRSIQAVDRTNQIQALQFDLPAPPSIRLYIHSYGGNLVASFAAYDVIRQLKSPVVTIGHGEVGSAATFLFLAGDERLMTEHCFLLLHQLNWEGGGTASEIKDHAYNLEMCVEVMEKIYVERSNMNRKQVRAMLANNKYLRSEAAIKHGLAHRKYGE